MTFGTLLSSQRTDTSIRTIPGPSGCSLRCFAFPNLPDQFPLFRHPFGCEHAEPVLVLRELVSSECCPAAQRRAGVRQYRPGRGAANRVRGARIGGGSRGPVRVPFRPLSQGVSDLPMT
ncbi:hypothetical protein D7M15_27875 [Streptomyces sp. Z26]|nr:hypothetical protein D7M15_27875 [Streptomyces sp. Z26]